MKFKKISKVIALFLAIVTLSVAVPITTNAAVKSDVPYPMRNNFVLDALQYLGYDVQKLKTDGFLYQEGYYGGDLIDEGNSSRRNYGLKYILSDITYDDSGSISGLNTKNGKPDVEYFKSNGLNCASFVTYVYLNYLPNVAKKADGSSYKDDATYKYIKKAMEHWTQVNGWSYQADDTWREAFNEYADGDTIKKHTASYSNISQMESTTNNNGLSQIQALELEDKLRPGDLICLGRLNKNGSVKDWVHVAIYLGTYNGEDYVAHCTGGDEGQLRNNGSGRGPEISTLSEIFARKSDDKFSYPIEFYALDWDYDFGTIEINKTGENGKKLAGAEFYITDGKGNDVTLVTDKNGFAKTRELPLGTYTVTETVFPEGFGTGTMQVVKGGVAISSTNSITVTLSSDSTEIVINAVNKVNTGMIYGYKATLNDAGKQEGLSGALMGLFNRNETIFTEETALQTCISGQTIPGTTTFHPGGYYFTNVKHGTYLIKEIEAPNGYVLSNETRTVTLNSDRAMVSTSIVNEKINGKIIGYKLDPNDRPLAGAKIGLYKRPPHEQFDSTPINVYVTGNDGYFEFNNLPVGMYYIQEIEAPLGYILSDALYPRRVVNNTPIEIKIYNDLFYEEIQGIKVDNNGLPLEGALIGIFKLSTTEFTEANALASVVTDENGYFEFTNLTRGVYIVREISPAPGYVLSTQQFNVKILDENKITIDGVFYEGEAATASINIEIVNEPIKITGTKLDSNKEPLAGAVIGLFAYTQTEYTKENALQISTSDSEGSFLFSTLPGGRYRIKELSAPDGYEINDDVYILIVTADGKYSIRNEANEILESLEIINNPIPHSISVTKLDTLGNTLTGAEFLLEWSNDGVNYLPVVTTASYDAAVGCTTTLVVDGKACVSESGTLTFEGLCPNLYYRLTETKAPNGYNLLKEAAFEDFVSISDNILVELNVINTQTFILPPTGGYASYIVPIGVIASVIIASVAIYLIKTNRKERKHDKEKFI